MIPTLISDPVHWQNTSTIGQLRLPLVTDGIVYDKKLKAHEFDSQTGVSPTRGPELSKGAQGPTKVTWLHTHRGNTKQAFNIKHDSKWMEHLKDSLFN